MKSKVKYVIWNEVTTRTNLFSCGGCVALCVLFDNLKELGAEVYFSHEIEQTLPDLKEYQDKDFFNNIKSPNLDEFIAIYPEVTIGNPLNCKRVVRWLLHYPDEIFKEAPASYGNEDRLFAYASWIAKGSKLKGFKVEDKLLNTFYISHNIFCDKKQTRRGNCYMVKKGHVKDTSLLDDSLDITPYCNDPHELSKIFNKCENFYIYDNRTYLGVLAALCGCNSILINTENQTKEEYFDGFPHFFKLALAHGKNDLDRLKTDRKLLKQELMREEQRCKWTIKDFIDCTNYP